MIGSSAPFLFVGLSRPVVVARGAVDLRFPSIVGEVEVEVVIPAEQRADPVLDLGDPFASKQHDDCAADPGLLSEMWAVSRPIPVLDDLPRTELTVLGPHRDAPSADLASFGRDGTRFVTATRIRLTTIDEIPASPAVLHHAFLQAGIGTTPPIQHELLRDARGSLDRGLMRRAALDAGTATELALVELAEERGVPIDKANDTLGRIIGKLRGAGVLSGAEHAELKANVVDARNDAAHRGASTPAATRSAVKSAARCLARFSPLPYR